MTFAVLVARGGEERRLRRPLIDFPGRCGPHLAGASLPVAI